MRISKALFVVGMLLVTAGVLSAGDALVGFDSKESRARYLAAWNAEVLDAVPELEVYLLRFTGGEEPEDLTGRDGIRFAEGNMKWRTPEGLQSSIWFLERRVVSPVGEFFASQPRLMPGAEATTTIAWLDGAVDATHPSIAGVLDGGYDFVDGDTDPSMSGEVLESWELQQLPGYNHATAVGSIMAETAPGVRMRLYRVLDETGEGTALDIAKGIVAAVRDGADVILLALGSRNASGAVTLALAHAAERDVIVVAAAGNDADGKVYHPASDPNAMGVAAVDDFGAASDFTSFGAHVDISDRGVLLPIAWPENGVGVASGTSMAAARTAAAAAVLRRAAPHLPASGIEMLILGTAAPLNEPNPNLSRKLGEGITDLEAALAVAARTRRLLPSAPVRLR